MPGKILVVDDDRAMVDTLCDILELRGWTAVRAFDGQDAEALAVEHDVDVVLMDVRMPKVDGVDALRRIRRAHPRTRVILMTAYAAQELLSEAEREGALEILRKPVRLDELLDLLERASREARSVLVVDDNVDYLATLSDALQQRGIHVVQARTLPEALARLEAHAPATVLLDLRLDHVDPEASMLAIREISPFVLLILYSGHDLELSRAVASAPRGLVDAAFTKPLSIERLLEVLDAGR